MKDVTFGYYRYIYSPSEANSVSFEEQDSFRILPENRPYIITVTASGEVCFHDADGNLLGKADGTDRKFLLAAPRITEKALSIYFGRSCTVDHYPHCDGEYDRWGTKWVSERIVTMDPATGEVTVSCGEDD